MKFGKLSTLLLVATLSLAMTQTALAGRFKPGDQTIAQIAVADGNFTTLVAALSCTGLVGVVANPAVELTVFAPTDAAFADLGLNAHNICDVFDDATLTTILLYHVVEGQIFSGNLQDGVTAPTLQGQNIAVDLSVGVKINESNVTTADIITKNGVIHIIDAVLLPASN